MGMAFSRSPGHHREGENSKIKVVGGVGPGGGSFFIFRGHYRYFPWNSAPDTE
jgi:hypothetical protein